MGQSKLSKCIIFLSICYMFYSIINLYNIIIPKKCTHSCIQSVALREDTIHLKLFISENNTYHNDEHFKINISDCSKAFRIVQPVNIPQTANGSLYAHVVLFVNEQSVDRQIYNLTYYQPIKHKNINLLSKSSSNDTTEIYSHWKGVIYLSLLEPVPLDPQSLSPHIARTLKITHSGEYIPILYINELKFVRDDGMVINTSSMLNLTIDYSPISLGLYLFHAEMLTSMESLKDYGVNEKAFDELKSLLNTNLYLLFVTLCVSMIHMLLDLMAMKSEVDFWRENKSNEGISISAVRWRCISSIVILFYLLDQKTSMLILFPFSLGVILEIWKVFKSMRATVHLSWPFVKCVQPSKEELDTWAVEMECVRLMSPFIYPLLAGTAVYTLIYVPQKSWYSWILSSLANGVYCFGFVFMLPQLYINYKLKSVDKLPWTALIYKGVNAFIDDIFAFVIQMPTAHRLARFRDDIVFIIYMGQRWMYPVDDSRTSREKED